MSLLTDVAQAVPSVAHDAERTVEAIRTLQIAEGQSQSGAFQWRDGMLVDALRQVCRMCVCVCVCVCMLVFIVFYNRLCPI